VDFKREVNLKKKDDEAKRLIEEAAIIDASRIKRKNLNDDRRKK